MPLILRPEDYSEWLSPGSDNPLDTLKRTRGDELHGYRVRRAVNLSRSDEAEFIEPVDY